MSLEWARGVRRIYGEQYAIAMSETTRRIENGSARIDRATSSATPDVIPKERNSNLKRKLSINNQISLSVFVRMLEDICENALSYLKLPNFETYLDNFDRYRHDNFRAKRARARECELKIFDERVRQQMYLKIVYRLFHELEERGHALHFSREYLKYFLTTYPRWVKVEDFSGINRIQKHSKKNKISTRLTNGAILVEYFKMPEMFAGNLNRCDDEDASALRAIVSRGISLPSSIYNVLQSYQNLPDVKYVIESETVDRSSTHVRVPINNTKRAILILTKHLIVVHDQHNNQFLLPQPHIEREFTTASLQNLQFDIVILDVLLGKKIKILDIYLSKCETLSDEYAERLATIARLFPTLRVAQPCGGDDATTVDRDGAGYVEKAKIGKNETNYMYARPLATVAVFSVHEKQAYLAYRSGGDGGDVLTYKAKVNVSGPSTFVLSTCALERTIDATECPMVMIHDRRYKLRNAPSELIVGDKWQLFREAVAVELRDNNKLGALSRNDVSDVSEFKQTQPHSRDMSNLSNLDEEQQNVFINSIVKAPFGAEFLRKLVRAFDPSH